MFEPADGEAGKGIGLIRLPEANCSPGSFVFGLALLVLWLQSSR